jgi:ankyrin repeat protein
LGKNYKVVKLLLEAGANPNIKINGITAIESAKKKKHNDIINLLKKYESKKSNNLH